MPREVAGVIPARPVSRLPLLAEDLSDPAALFGRAAALHVDLGCAGGHFLVAMATSCPGANFLGVEKKAYRADQSRRRAAREGAPNVRVVQGDAREAMAALPAGSVAVCHVSFPDPWPKRRHAVRRLMDAEFVAVLHRSVAAGGELRFATDHADYFAAAWRAVEAQGGWGVEAWEPPADYPRTDFEERFRARGCPVHRFRARRLP